MTSEDARVLAAWEQRTLDRSLDDARRRALGKSQRFLAAASQLMIETGGLAFTVQEVVDRSQMSLGSFYRAFEGKDELLLALFEKSVAHGAAMQQSLIADIADPVEQIQACLTFLATPRALAGEGDTPGIRAIIMLQFTLASTRPADLAHALEPQLLVFVDAVERGITSGQIRADIPGRRLAEILLSLALDAAQNSILRAGVLADADAPDDLWAFCIEGLLNRSANPASG
jgi:AcrR family transcriptional regulator